MDRHRPGRLLLRRQWVGCAIAFPAGDVGRGGYIIAGMSDYLKFTGVVLKQVAKTFGVPTAMMGCDHTSYASVSIEIASVPNSYQTHAASQIALMPPIRFPVRLANRLGNRCVRELAKIEARQ